MPCGQAPCAWTAREGSSDPNFGASQALFLFGGHCRGRPFSSTCPPPTATDSSVSRMKSGGDQGGQSLGLKWATATTTLCNWNSGPECGRAKPLWASKSRGGEGRKERSANASQASSPPLCLKSPYHVLATASSRLV